jgi:hypothetical protein
MESLNLKTQEKPALLGKREWHIEGTREHVSAIYQAMESQGIELDEREIQKTINRNYI